ncbi:MAG: VWA domain-containing protein [Candidatus Lokiarchaeota archaeon]|nr:VWA domain-containing protein [Candidatus Lokiarchaeota archaeon]
MFTDFFFLLRERQIPVSIKEYMSLIEALDKGLITTPVEFYYIARALLVKDEKFFDLYDQAYLHYFEDAELPPLLSDELMEWLDKPVEQLKKIIPDWMRHYFSEEDLEDLKERFYEMLRRQKEEHNGGSQFIGTNGMSPFGHGGQYPDGIRVGGTGGLKMAAKIAHRRHFRNYREDRVIDTRTFKVALKKLRKLNRIGLEDELDLDETIDKTCKNLGDIELVFRKRKKNNIKLLLLMDVGGSMDPHAALLSRLFSAAHGASHFKDFKYYYFHNCVYGYLYKDIEREERIPTGDVLKKLDSDYKVIIVGDADMAPSELVATYGSIQIGDETYTPGIVWLKRIEDHFKKCVWLNPDMFVDYKGYTRQTIEKVFPSFRLTIEGLEEAIQELL